ncbi:MAG: Rpn family recombination-promoting nuclease/putative transposase [Clostridium sp.]
MSDKDFKPRKVNIDDGFIMSPKNDFAFKLIFGDEKNIDLLIELLSVILKIDKYRFANIRLINTELNREFAEDRKGILDVRAKMNDGTEIDIEIQLSHTKYMAERTLYYWSKMYTNQIKSGDSYVKLKKCVTINIVDFTYTEVNKAYSKYNLTESETGYKLTDVMEIYFLELEKLRDPKIEIDEDDKVIQWMMFLEAKSKEVLEMLGEKNEAIKKATSILEVMSHDEDTRRAYEAREAALHDEVTKIQEAEENIKLQNAKNFLVMGVSEEMVAKGTGLDLQLVLAIKEKLN